jgi:heptosyltransferase-2
MKILVRAPNWVGDAVMAIPALEAIRRAHAAAEIAILTRPAVADLYREQPFANKILEYDNSGRHQGWWGREKLVGELRREKFDLAVLLQNAFEAAWLAWRAGIPERAGYARDGRGLLLTKPIPVPKEGDIPRHESHFYLELVRRAKRRKRRCCVPAQGKAHGAARSHRALPTERRSAGRRNDLQLWRTV